MFISSAARILAALYSNKRPGEVAAGVALALWAAMIPGSSPLFWLVFMAIFLVKVNQAVALLALAVLGPMSPGLDPVLHSIGHAILTSETLYNTWSALYALPLMSLTRFNNTVVMGGLVAGPVVFPAVFFGVRSMVIPIRTKLVPRIAGSALVRKLYSSPKIARFIEMFRKWNSLYETIGV